MSVDDQRAVRRRPMMCRGWPPKRSFAPVRVLQFDLSATDEELEAVATSVHEPYGAALCLVRNEGRPLGTFQISLPPTGLRARGLRDAASDVFLLSPDKSGRGRETRDKGPRVRVLGDDSPSLTVIIPSRGRPLSLVATLDSVLDSDFPTDRLEIIVADNAFPGEQPVCLGRDPKYAAIRIVREPRPGGSNARNAGLSVASGEVVVFIDDDVLIERDCLTRLVDPFRDDKQVAASAGLILPQCLDTPAQALLEAFGGFTRGFESMRFSLDAPPPRRPLFPFTLGDLGSGGVMAFRREVLQDVGGFDPALGTATPTLGGEDLEAKLRVLLTGLDFVYEPAAIAWHAHPADIAGLRRRVWGYGVGLTAALTKGISLEPGLALDLIPKLRGGISYALSSRSEKNSSKGADYPISFTLLELAGLAWGPLAYARSKTRTRQRPSPPPGSGLRVLLVTDFYPPLVGGANFWAQRVARHMKARGHTVEVVTSWQPTAQESDLSAGVPVHRVRDLFSRLPILSSNPHLHVPPPFPDPEAVSRLRRKLSARSIQISSIRMAGSHTLWRRRSLVSEFRCSYPLRTMGISARLGRSSGTAPSARGPGPSSASSARRERYGPAKGTVAASSVLGVRPLLRRKITAVHSISRFVKAKMDRYLINGSEIPDVLIPNFGEDLGRAEPNREILAKLPGEPFILYVGLLRAAKGMAKELLHAYAGLEGEAPPLVLACPRLADAEIPEAVPDGARIISGVSHPTVMAMWEHALFGVFPSRWAEPLGMVVFEAMSRGVAVIGTRPGGHEDMIVEGVSGLLVQAGEVEPLRAAMTRLIADGELRNRMGRAAQAEAKRFTPEAVIPELEDLYRDTASVRLG